MSIWKDSNVKSYPELKENCVTDILVIGGGITGVSTLYHLRKSKLKVMMVEQNKIGYSTTGNSTGKLSFLQNDLIDKIRKKHNDDIASLYLKSQINAIKNIVETIKKEKISCNLTKTDCYLYTNNESEINKIKSLEEFLKKNNLKIYHDDISLVKSKYAINVLDTYVFNPIQFIYGLLNKINFPIYENTSIRKIKYQDGIYVCDTGRNIIKTKYIVLASHYPYFIIPYLFPIKVSLEKSYISASKYNIKPISLISYSNPFISLRTYEDYLIYLSNSHNINKNTCDKDNYNELLKKLNDLNLKPDYLWSNIDIMTSDGLPLVGTLKNNIFMGTGYNTWGLTNGFLAGEILADCILENDNEYIKLFNPNRSNLNSLNDLFNNVKGFAEGLKNGAKYSCPHLKCKLIYNEVDETFDCPCHGSRFRKDGKCISGPANKDIAIKTTK